MKNEAIAKLINKEQEMFLNDLHTRICNQMLNSFQKYERLFPNNVNLSVGYVSTIYSNFFIHQLCLQLSQVVSDEETLDKIVDAICNKLKQLTKDEIKRIKEFEDKKERD